MTSSLDSAPILQMATAFWPSKVLLTAVELDVFSALGASSLTAEELGNSLGIHPRGWYDFFDCLVALGFLAAVAVASAVAELQRGKPPEQAARAIFDEVLRYTPVGETRGGIARAAELYQPLSAHAAPPPRGPSPCRCRAAAPQSWRH